MAATLKTSVTKLAKLATVFISIWLQGVKAHIKHKSPYFNAMLTCQPDHMEVKISYHDGGEFSGVVYTEGSYGKQDCHTEINNQKEIIFYVPFDGCKTQEVKDGTLVNTLIIQHHHRIMTGDDAAFKLKCDWRSMRHHIKVTKSIHMVHEKKDKLADSTNNYEQHETIEEQQNGGVNGDKLFQNPVEVKPAVKFSEIDKKKHIKTIDTKKGTYVFVDQKNITRHFAMKY